MQIKERLAETKEQPEIKKGTIFKDFWKLKGDMVMTNEKGMGFCNWCCTDRRH